MHAVELNIGPMFALFCVKIGPIFVVLFLKSRSPCRKKRIAKKQNKNKQ